MRSDGSDQRRLTTNDLSDVWPSASPDGQRLIYVRYDQDAVAQTAEYRGMTLDDLADISIGSPGIDRVAWSPDGASAALTTWYAEGLFDIVRLRLDGSEYLRMTDWAEEDKEPAWSPDGQTIAFTRYIGGQGYLFVMNASDGSNARQLVQDVPAWEPSWSPDGSQIAFWSGDNASTQIYLVGADGQNLRPLTQGPGYHENPAWSPDGQWIAYWSDVTGDRDIYITRPDGSETINLTNSPGEDENPAWLIDK
jgi:Tol biopolymer transport system component